MKKSLALRILPLALLAFVPALIAQSTQVTSNNAADGAQAPEQTQLKSRVLVKSVISFDTPSSAVALSASPQALDPATTITCPNQPATCTIVADVNVQLGFSSSATNTTAICFVVDGSVTNNGSCPDLASIPTNNWSALSFSMVTTSTPGTHSIQTQVWPSSTASRGFYTVTYRVYKP